MRLIVIVWLFACDTAEKDGLSNASTENGASNTDTSNNYTTESLEATQAFRVPERAWDLALGPDGLVYCSTQGGDIVYVYDPVSEERTEFEVSLPDVQNLWLAQDGTVYFTRTDYGITGSVSMVNGPRTEDLFSQADDGTLFRWPMDIVETPESTEESLSWVVADFGAGLLFWIHTDGAVTAHPAGSSKPQSLLFVDNTLYIAGEDGIFKQDWPTGTPQRIDDRTALALEWIDGSIWSGNSNDGIFEVEGHSVGLNQAARPGSLLMTESGLFFADHVGEGVWVYTGGE